MIAKRIARGGRRYGRIEGDSQGDLATHRITIGWDRRADGADKPFPGRLPGFLITRDTLGPDGRWIIDWPAMRMLGDYTPEKFAAIWKHKDTLAAPPDLLPQTLRFVLMNDALVVPGGFSYPGTIAEEYQLYNSQGRFCHGDGDTASRKRGDGGQERIQCNPIGKMGCTEFCPFSVKGECKSRSRVLLCLYTLDSEANRQLLAPSLGETARFRWETSSEYNSINILETLDRVAERLYAPDLWPNSVSLKYLTGVLTFSVRKRVSPKGGKVKVQQVGFSIDESAIVAREEKIQAEREKQIDRQIEYHKTGFEPKLIAAPVSTPGLTADPQPVERPQTMTTTVPQPQPVYEQPDYTQTDDQQADDDPFTGEPEGLTIDNADPLELADALTRYLEARGTAESVSDEVILSTIAAFNVRGKTYHAESVDWYFAEEGKDARKHGARMRILRDTCHRIEGDEWWDLQPMGGGDVAEALPDEDPNETAAAVADESEAAS